MHGRGLRILGSCIQGIRKEARKRGEHRPGEQAGYPRGTSEASSIIMVWVRDRTFMMKGRDGKTDQIGIIELASIVPNA